MTCRVGMNAVDPRAGPWVFCNIVKSMQVWEGTVLADFDTSYRLKKLAAGATLQRRLTSDAMWMKKGTYTVTCSDPNITPHMGNPWPSVASFCTDCVNVSPGVWTFTISDPVTPTNDPVQGNLLYQTIHNATGADILLPTLTVVHSSNLTRYASGKKFDPFYLNLYRKNDRTANAKRVRFGDWFSMNGGGSGGSPFTNLTEACWEPDAESYWPYSGVTGISRMMPPEDCADLLMEICELGGNQPDVHFSPNPQMMKHLGQNVSEPVIEAFVARFKARAVLLGWSAKISFDVNETWNTGTGSYTYKTEQADIAGAAGNLLFYEDPGGPGVGVLTAWAAASSTAKTQAFCGDMWEAMYIAFKNAFGLARLQPELFGQHGFLSGPSGLHSYYLGPRTGTTICFLATNFGVADYLSPFDPATGTNVTQRAIMDKDFGAHTSAEFVTYYKAYIDGSTVPALVNDLAWIRDRWPHLSELFSSYEDGYETAQTFNIAGSSDLSQTYGWTILNATTLRSVEADISTWWTTGEAAITNPTNTPTWTPSSGPGASTLVYIRRLNNTDVEWYDTAAHALNLASTTGRYNMDSGAAGPWYTINYTRANRYGLKQSEVIHDPVYGLDIKRYFFAALDPYRKLSMQFYDYGPPANGPRSLDWAANDCEQTDSGVILAFKERYGTLALDAGAISLNAALSTTASLNSDRAASGEGSPTYQWYRGLTTGGIVPLDGGIIFESQNGATTEQLGSTTDPSGGTRPYVIQWQRFEPDITPDETPGQGGGNSRRIRTTRLPGQHKVESEADKRTRRIKQRTIRQPVSEEELPDIKVTKGLTKAVWRKG